MSKYNPTQRARDLRNANQYMKRAMSKGVDYENRVIRMQQAVIEYNEKKLAVANRRVRNHRWLSGIVLVLVTAAQFV